MTTKLIVLGCGGSLGVPNIMNRNMGIDFDNPRNYRTRTSAWVEHDGKNFLIDTSADLRTQLFHCKLVGIRPDAVLYTHTHADHCNGIDDLRAYFWPDQRLVDIYGSQESLSELHQRFNYLFTNYEHALYGKQILQPHIIQPGTQQIAGTEVQTIALPHGDLTTYAYRFGDIAWCTDFQHVPDAAVDALQGIKIWCAAVSDSDEPHPSHALLSHVVEVSQRLGRPETYLIHLSPKVDFAALDARTPPHIRPAYDGLVLQA